MTPTEVILRFLLNNPHPIGLPAMAEAIVAVLRHSGFDIVRTEAADAE